MPGWGLHSGARSGWLQHTSARFGDASSEADVREIDAGADEVRAALAIAAGDLGVAGLIGADLREIPKGHTVEDDVAAGEHRVGARRPLLRREGLDKDGAGVLGVSGPGSAADAVVAHDDRGVVDEHVRGPANAEDQELGAVAIDGPVGVVDIPIGTGTVNVDERNAVAVLVAMVEVVDLWRGNGGVGGPARGPATQCKSRESGKSGWFGYGSRATSSNSWRTRVNHVEERCLN